MVLYARLTWMLLALGVLAVGVWLDQGSDTSDDGSAPPPQAISGLERANGSEDAAASTQSRSPEPPAGKGTNQKVAVTADNPLAVIDRSALDAIVSRPLFTPSRRAYKPPPPRAPVRRVVKAPPPVDRKVRYQLLGVMAAGPARVAILMPKGGNRKVRARVGDQVGGWTVKGIGIDHIVLAAGSETQRIAVFQADGRLGQ